ncbi:serine hydrolase [Paraburkholderia sp. LEh10]|uniref:serine hydrolase n=1 Tax=Paraburkholderia sp. LEh10 TaxID=2821353 RepID=UPI001AEB23F0|nr:serine hydrolase [Paraburkholderia sp. LEh10]MBP0588562.1 serine hydrolase [Paraburkholderia sp. LEh10]
MKKVICALLFAATTLPARADAPFLYSHSAIVYDIARGEVLLQKNPDDVQAIASLTKLMSAMVVLDSAQSMYETLTIDDADIDRLKHSGSRIPVGASLEREAMLRLALMSSENRAASALSRAFPGGQAAFILTMNNKARALHMMDTHFDDPSGLSPDNLSTARDVVKLAAAASRYPLIGSFTTLPDYEEVVGSRMRLYRNTDPVVLWQDWDVQLAKTGYTREAGRCIVVDVNMPNGELIIALLGARSSRARLTDLVTIRRWLNGDETPIVAPRRYYASARPHRHYAVLAQSHRVKMRFVSYRPGAGAGVHRQNIRRRAS